MEPAADRAGPPQRDARAKSAGAIPERPHPPGRARTNETQVDEDQASNTHANNGQANDNQKRETFMGRILFIIGALLLIGILSVIGYAYLGDLTPSQREQRLDVVLPEAPGGN